MTVAVQPFPFAAEFGDSSAAPSSRTELEAEVARLRTAVAEAREEGRAAGAAEALAELRAERDTALLAASEALTAALGEFCTRFATVEQDISRLGAELALDFADHLAGLAIARDPARGIDEAIGRALEQVRRGVAIRVRVAPGLAHAVEACIAQRQAADRRQLHLHVVPDPALSEGDARIEWDSGALILDRAARHAALSQELSALLAA